MHQGAPGPARLGEGGAQPGRELRRVAQRREVVDADLLGQPEQRPVLVLHEEVEVGRRGAEADRAGGDEQVLEGERDRGDVAEALDALHPRVVVPEPGHDHRADPDRDLPVAAEHLVGVAPGPLGVLVRARVLGGRAEEAEVLRGPPQHQLGEREPALGLAHHHEAPRLGAVARGGVEGEPQQAGHLLVRHRPVGVATDGAALSDGVQGVHGRAPLGVRDAGRLPQ